MKAEAPERRDASPRLIALGGAMLAVLIGGSLGSARLLAGPGWARAATAAWGEAARFAHGPEAAPDVVSAWGPLEHDVQEHLHTYGWVDRRRGILRIPLERAMALTAQEAHP